jgi:hypothetical protein
MTPRRLWTRSQQKRAAVGRRAYGAEQGSIPEGDRVRATPQRRDDDTHACPVWCRRDHRPGDHPDDLLHQSAPAQVAVVLGEPRFGPDERPRAETVVLRLAQRRGSAEIWLEASSEEGRSLHLLVSAESARRLAGAMVDLLSAL